MISFVLTKYSLPTNCHFIKKINSKKVFFFKNTCKINIFNSNFHTRRNLCMNGQIENQLEIWEMDFFSRPVVNSDGKKIWELIIVDDNHTFEHVEVIPNNLVNSKELKKRIKNLIDSK